MTKTRSNSGDHRNYNRDGEAFNVGETFAGLRFEKGVALVEELREFAPADFSMVDLALRWILDFEAVTTVIPGASRPDQVLGNVRAARLPRLSPNLPDRLSEFYESRVKEHIRGPY